MRCGSPSDIGDYAVENSAWSAAQANPETITTAIQRVAPSPARTSALVNFSLPGSAPARLVLIDLTGRTVERVDVDVP
jgi:hypothetical protein